MITVSRLGGNSFALNPDLIERIESTPDTVLVMVDATRYIVAESASEIIAKIRENRAQILARAQVLTAQTEQDEERPPVALAIGGENLAGQE